MALVGGDSACEDCGRDSASMKKSNTGDAVGSGLRLVFDASGVYGEVNGGETLAETSAKVRRQQYCLGKFQMYFEK